MDSYEKISTNPANVDILNNLYPHLMGGTDVLVDIDLGIGILLEDQLKSSQLGNIALSLIKLQFNVIDIF